MRFVEQLVGRAVSSSAQTRLHFPCLVEGPSLCVLTSALSVESESVPAWLCIYMSCFAQEKP